MNEKTVKKKMMVTTDVDIEYTLKTVNSETEIVVHNFNVDANNLKNKVAEDLRKEQITAGDYLGYKLYETLTILFTGGTK